MKNSHERELIFRFSTIAIALLAWVTLLIMHDSNNAIQSALDLLLGAAVGYHSRAAIETDSKEDGDDNG